MNDRSVPPEPISGSVRVALANAASNHFLT
jgi:hypothetical protein